MTTPGSTIAAIATPAGKGGIGIIKISGRKASVIAASIFKESGEKTGAAIGRADRFESHRIYHGRIVDPISGRALDEVLLTVMKAPRSYTREDVVEINAHSGTMVLRAIFELVLSRGARLAEPGEFTKRAFLNGRIDLTQAEGVIDIINARTERALEIAQTQLNGALGHRLRAIRGGLLDAVSALEAEIDFPEDLGEVTTLCKGIEALEQKTIPALTALLEGFRTGRYLRDGLKVGIVGRPNVGKSSLLNRILDKDRVIVSPIPGTTRDVVEAAVDIQGLPVVFADTAGFQQSTDPVERIGIQKTLDAVQEADLVLWVVDAGDPGSPGDAEMSTVTLEKQALIVVNKIDLLGEGQRYSIPDEWNLPAVYVSALYNQGIEGLKRRISEMFTGRDTGSGQDIVVPNVRHKQAIERCRTAVRNAVAGYHTALPTELIAIDLREAVDALGEILGVTTRENILDEIFSRFCIGK